MTVTFLGASRAPLRNSSPSAVDAPTGTEEKTSTQELTTHFFFAARFRLFLGTGVRSSKCRDTVGVKCSDVIGNNAESQPALPLLCAKGPLATRFAVSYTHLTLPTILLV